MGGKGIRCALLLAGVAWAAGAHAAEKNTIIARVGGESVSVDEVRPWLDAMEPREREALQKDPTLLNQTVRAILVRRALLNEALAKHWEQEPAIAKKLEQLRRNAISDTYLQAQAEPPANYPEDSDLRKAYEENRAVLGVPRQYRLAQIFVANPKDADKASAEQAQVRLKAILQKLRPKDAEFSSIAQKYSEEPQSAARGGEIGWLTEAQVQPELRAQVTGLDPKSWSDPIRLADGWHILRLLEVKEARTPSLEEARPLLVRQMRADKTKLNAQNYLAKLAQQTPIAVDELALPGLLGTP